MNSRTNSLTAKKLLWLAIGLVLMVNGFILGKVYLNRSEVIAQLQLSEREVQLPYNYGFSKEDSSARVSLNWKTPFTEKININMNEWGWNYNHRLQLNEVHFLSFQFPDCTQKTRLHQKRKAWVLLELNGQSYADYVSQVEQYHAILMDLTPEKNTKWSEKEIVEKRKSSTRFLMEAKTAHTRLFVIDAAADRELIETALRNRQTTANNQLAIVPGEIRASYNRCDNKEKNTTEVIIGSLSAESLYIPKHFSQHLPKADHENKKSKFTMEISYGRFFEPWVSGFKQNLNAR